METMKCIAFPYTNKTSFSSGYRYSFEGVLQAIYGFDREPLDCDQKQSKVCMFNSGEDVLKELDVENAKFYIDFIVLVGFFIILRLACYMVLRYKVKVHWNPWSCFVGGCWASILQVISPCSHCVFFCCPASSTFRWYVMFCGQDLYLCLPAVVLQMWFCVDQFLESGQYSTKMLEIDDCRQCSWCKIVRCCVCFYQAFTGRCIPAALRCSTEVRVYLERERDPPHTHTHI